MKRVFLTCVMMSLTFAANIQARVVESATISNRINSSALQNRIVGEVTTIDSAAGRIVVKADNGNLITLMLDDKTTYLRVPPGETTMEKAVKISLGDISVGDRLLVFANTIESGKPVAVRQIVVMSKTAITQQQGRDVVGRITALNSKKKEITLQRRSQQGVETIIIKASGNVRFSRYAPDSIKRSDAVPSSFAELKVGNLLRAQGERSADGKQFAAEEIIAGSFLRAGGVVTSINTANGEVKIKNTQTGRPLTIVIGKRSTLRHIPPDVAKLLEQGKQPGGKSFQEMLEDLPVITLADLKKGDTVLVTSTTSANQSKVTAIMLFTGEEAFMARWVQVQPNDLQDMNPGLPGNVLGGGTGQQDPP